MVRPVLVSLALLTAVMGQSTAHAVGTPGSIKTCVYFDQVLENPKYRLGEVYAIMLQNLLGHFVEVETIQRKAKDYKAGDIGSCDRIAYIGSYFNAPTPEAFFKDIAATEKPVIWMNYGLWNLAKIMGEKEFSNKTGFEFIKLQGFDDPATKDFDPESPGFYQYFHYKGAKFRKLNYFNPIKKKVVATPEIGIVNNIDAKVLAVAEHNKNGSKTPYALQKGNFFYIGDIPFSFIHEVDRYFIICDLLFDFLGLEPRIKSGKRYAFGRIEDIGAGYEDKTHLIYQGVKAFKDRGLSFGISVISKFVDSFGVGNEKGPRVQPLGSTPKLLKALRYAVANKGRIIYHGYTHGLDCTINSWSGVSGDDFEFWDKFANAPVAIESRDWITDRLDRGMEIFASVGLNPIAWITPHYEASPLSYKIFGAYFGRTIQRGRYSPEPYDPDDKISWAGQFFPYTIEKDFYGQQIWPESLGNVNAPTEGYYSPTLRLPKDLLEAAKLQLVVRDGWASFFWHPFLIDELGIDTLTDLLDGIRKLGYEFVDIEELKNRGE